MSIILQSEDIDQFLKDICIDAEEVLCDNENVVNDFYFTEGVRQVFWQA